MSAAPSPLRAEVQVALAFLERTSMLHARWGAQQSLALLHDEISRLAGEAAEARAQLLADRAELDAYRALYGPLPERKGAA